MSDVVSGVETYEVEECKWSHGISAAELHGIVDVRNGPHSFFVRTDCIEQVRNEQAIYDEAGFIGGTNRNFTELLAEGHGCFHHFVRGGNRTHDLYEFHNRNRIKEMQADEAIDAPGGGHQFRD